MEPVTLGTQAVPIRPIRFFLCVFPIMGRSGTPGTSSTRATSRKDKRSEEEPPKKKLKTQDKRPSSRSKKEESEDDDDERETAPVKRRMGGKKGAGVESLDWSDFQKSSGISVSELLHDFW